MLTLEISTGKKKELLHLIKRKKKETIKKTEEYHREKEK